MRNLQNEGLMQNANNMKPTANLTEELVQKVSL
jgi:hypothetical protein